MPLSLLSCFSPPGLFRRIVSPHIFLCRIMFMLSVLHVSKLIFAHKSETEQAFVFLTYVNGNKWLHFLSFVLRLSASVGIAIST